MIGGHEVIEVAHGEQALGEGVGSAHGWLVCLVGGGLDCRGWAAVADCRWGVFQQPASGAALKEAILERAKKSGEKFSAAQLKSLENKAVQHAQTIAVPNEVHAAGETYESKNKPLYKDDAKDLAGAAKRDNAAHRKNIDNDKHKGCKGALNKAADEIDAITNDQYNKYFDKLIDDVLDGKNTIDPWKGIM